MKDKKVNLHIGCGDKILPGFVHIDIRALPNVDHVVSADRLTMFRDNSVDLIYACHVLEHFKRSETKKTLKEWNRVLKPGGLLRLAVPDFESLVKVYIKTKDLKLILGPLMGRQDYSKNTHYITFDYDYLAELVTGAGFTDIHRYDWRKTIHKDHDDYSQAYIPHMDKTNGILISLNIECKKKS